MADVTLPLSRGPCSGGGPLFTRVLQGRQCADVCSFEQGLGPWPDYNGQDTCPCFMHPPLCYVTTSPPAFPLKVLLLPLKSDLVSNS